MTAREQCHGPEKMLRAPIEAGTFTFAAKKNAQVFACRKGDRGCTVASREEENKKIDGVRKTKELSSFGILYISGFDRFFGSSPNVAQACMELDLHVPSTTSLVLQLPLKRNL